MSTVAAAEDAVATAPRVGADLCAARQRLGWSLEAVAAALRIRLPFLAALEEGRIADLPGNTYALGFLRSYARMLGLDADELTRRFRVEAAEVNRLTKLSFPVPVPSRGVPAGAVVLLGVVLAIGAYIGWYRLSGNGELPPEVVPPVPARLAPLAERAVPPAVVTQSSSTPSAASTPPAAATASAASTPPVSTPLAATSPASTPSAAASTAASPSQADAAVLPEPTPAQAVPATQAAAATTMPTGPAAQAQPTAVQSRIVLSATADAWMLVRDKAGQVLLNRVLHPGESWQVPAQPSLVFTTGNAGGTNILVDGAAIPSLGASGAVRHDIPLDPELLKAGKVPSAALPIGTASSGPPVAPPVAPRSGLR
jgi:cytoskeleton protein RodZ